MGALLLWFDGACLWTSGSKDNPDAGCRPWASAVPLRAVRNHRCVLPVDSMVRAECGPGPHSHDNSAPGSDLASACPASQRDHKESTMAAKPIPEGYHTVTPYLSVRGAAEVIDFLRQAFRAEMKKEPLKRPDGKIMHAQVKIGDSTV